MIELCLKYKNSNWYTCDRYCHLIGVFGGGFWRTFLTIVAQLLFINAGEQRHHHHSHRHRLVHCHFHHHRHVHRHHCATIMIFITVIVFIKMLVIIYAVIVVIIFPLMQRVVPPDEVMTSSALTAESTAG